MVSQIKNLSCIISVMDGPPGEGLTHPWQSFKIVPDHSSLLTVGVWWKADTTEEEIASSIGKAILLMLKGDE